jgi:hypothetical protein
LKIFPQNPLEKSAISDYTGYSWTRLQVPGGDLIVFPGGQRVQVKLANSISFRSLCSLPVAKEKCHVSSIGRHYEITDHSMFPVVWSEALMWQMVLFASRGRIPAGTNLIAPIHLRNWPNMTRLALFPHAMRIAAFWSARPHSLLETAEVLGIPQRYVFAFYSAAHALDLVSAGENVEDTPGGPAANVHSQKRGILGRILARLTHGRY